MPRSKKNTEEKIKEEDDNVTYAYEPDGKLRKLIGDKIQLKDIFTPERIQACQKMIDDAKEAFFDTAQPDLDVLKQELNGPADFRALARTASNIKGQADAFGLSFISQLTATLVGCCEAGLKGEAKMRELIQMLVEALDVAFKEKIDGDGGPTGRAMLQSLKGAL